MPMSALYPVLAVLLAGIGVALQPPTNAALARAGGSVILASLISFLVGSALLAVAWIVSRQGQLAGLRAAPAWTWMGGFYGACFVAALAFAAPRLGLAQTLTIAIASQVVAALVLDQFSALGLAQTPLTSGRIAGAALVIGGAVLVRRG